MRFLFDSKPTSQAELFSEACSLIDDGLDTEFVLGLYPDEAEWLAPMLATTTGVVEAIESEQPSYFFEASLKSKFLAAAREQRTPAVAPAAGGYAPLSQVRTALASATVVLSAAAMGVVMLAFVTSDDAVPGDWNYSVKLAQERIEYSLARGDGKVDVQINRTEARVAEIRQRGENASANDIKRLQSELLELETLAREKGIDELQRAQLEALAKSAKAVLSTVTDKQAPPAVVKNANDAADDVFAAASGGAAALPTPEPSETAGATAATASETPTAAATGTPTSAETPTPPTETPTATAETPTPTTETPAPTETATPTDSATQPIEEATPTTTPLP